MESKTPEECRRCIHGEVCRYVHVEKPEPCVFRDLGPVEELAALKEAAERIVLMWDNCYIEPYSADAKDYIERMRKAIKEADHADS